MAADFEREEAAVRACTVAADCGQILVGTSCGCTRERVARLGADTTRDYALIDEASTLGCDLGLVSPCDCPPVSGFGCVAGTCTWQSSSAWLPDCRTRDGDPFQQSTTTLDGDIVHVTGAYGGGCAEHDFPLCWPDPVFQDEWPVQAWLELQHDANDDPCDAWLTETVDVDLRPLRAAWREQYGDRSGRILVHLGDTVLDYRF